MLGGDHAPEFNEREIFSLKGKTFVNVSLGDILLAINEKSICKIFELDNVDKEEPEVVDTCDSIVAFTPVFKLPTTNKWAFCLADKTQNNVYLYTHDENIAMAQPKIIFRSFLDIRDICIVHGGKMLAVATDDLEIKLISLDEEGLGNAKSTTTTTTSIKISKPVVNISFSHVSNTLAVSLNDGSLSMWSLSSDTPRLVSNEELLNYVTPNYMLSLDNEADEEQLDLEAESLQISTSKVAFGESNGVFACCDDLSISSYSISNLLEKTKTYKHSNKIKDFKYCGGDNYICLIDYSNKLVLWHIPSETIVFNNYITQDNHTNKLTNLTWKKSSTSNNNFNIYCGSKNGNVIFVENVLAAKNVSVLSTKHSNSNSNKSSSVGGLFLDDSDNEEIDQDLTNIQKTQLEISTTLGNGKNKGKRLFDDEAMEDGGDDEEAETDDNNINNANGGSRKKPHFDDYDDLDEELKNLNNDSFADEEDDEIDDDGFGNGDESDIDGQDGNDNGRFAGDFARRGYSNASSELREPWSCAFTRFHQSDRRYLTMNSIGYAWTVKSSTTQSVTVSFFDRSTYREYYFEDYNISDVCSLGEKGILLANSSNGEVTYRSHSTDSNKWSRTIPLRRREIITSVALTNKKCFIGTSSGNFYELNMFGFIINLERLSPVAAMTAYQNRVFVIHKASTLSANTDFLSFSLFDDKKYYQRESLLPIKKFMKNIFFTQYGDPAIFSNENQLLLLSRWRTARNSRWVPMLDVSFELWRSSGGNKSANDIHCWPLGISGNYNNTLNYIMLKGSKRYPEFPLPLPTEMEIKLPIFGRRQFEEIKKKNELEKKIRKEENDGLPGDDSGDENEDDIAYGTRELEVPQDLNAEEEFLKSKICHSMLEDTIDNDGEMYGDETATLDQLNTIYDKSLLRLFASACAEGDIKKAYSLVIELKQDRALGAATKIAERAELMQLAEKINQLRDARTEQEMGM